MHTMSAYPPGVRNRPALAFHPDDHRRRPDPLRISGIAAAIALNLGVLLVLLRPADLPLPDLNALSDRIQVQLIEARPKPPEPPPQIIEDLTRRKPEPAPRPALPQMRQTPPAAPVAAASQASASPLDMPADPVPASPGDSTSNGLPEATAATGPLAGAMLALREAPRPTYPREALVDGREGVVRLLVRVDRQGRPREVSIQRSSGHRDLDQAARQQVLRRWLFHPAFEQGQPVEASGVVEVAFALQ